ncbi:MAG: trigger factor [Actinomycetota bacterium]
MKTTVEELEDDRVKLSVEVGADEFEVEVDKAFKKIAKEVRMPGFRKGKVPRPVLEARFGSGVARGQALEDSIPQYFMDALSEVEVDIISPPEYEITAGEEEGDLAFDAVVQIRPTVEVSGYEGMTIEVPSLEPSDEDIDARVDSFRSQFGELESVERAAADGDTVTMDIATTYDGESVEGLTADDYSYRVGSGGLVAELDDNLLGAEIDAALAFEAPHPAPDEDGDLSFEITIKDIQEMVLPELTDELVSDASDFETVDDFRSDVIEKLREQRLDQARTMWQDESASKLGELVDLDPPESLIDTEVRNRVEDMAQRLAQSGIAFEQYLQMMGQDIEGLLDQMREPAVAGVKVDMGLRALAAAEGLEATDEDVDAEFESLAENTGIPIDNLREQIATPNQLMLFRADISKRKAADWLLENVDVVDEDGNPVDKEALQLESDEEE